MGFTSAWPFCCERKTPATYAAHVMSFNPSVDTPRTVGTVRIALFRVPIWTHFQLCNFEVLSCFSLILPIISYFTSLSVSFQQSLKIWLCLGQCQEKKCNKRIVFKSAETEIQPKARQRENKVNFFFSSFLQM